MFYIKRHYFNKTNIIKGLYQALLFTSPIIFDYIGIYNQLISTVILLFSMYFLFTLNKPSLFFSGFFIGLFWFYWISFSFIFYDLAILIPLVLIIFALFYGILFLLIGIKDNIFLKASIFLLIYFFEPFGFNWFKLDILLLNTYFDTSQLVFILIVLSSILLFKKRYLLYFLSLLVIFFINEVKPDIKTHNLNISMPKYMVNQDFKWNPKNLTTIINDNLNNIDKAILNGDDLVVLPETAFPMIVNKNEFILEELLRRSQNIAIVTGALYFEDGQYKNSTYIFKNGNYNVAHKVVLVPFGEAVPLPAKIKNFINDVFYDGAKDYVKAVNPSNYKIKDTIFRNAICYEATSSEIYENLDNINYVIAISNNAWFMPSSMPNLQKLLLQLYSNRNNVIIYHQINGSQNYVISPN